MIKVLVVEDEYIIRKGMINTIDWLSMDCKIIGEGINGREGLKLIEEFAPDLVITDIRMPVMDGLEMLKTAEEAGLKFEKIILTSYGEFKYAQEGIKLGVADYILKPIDEELLEKAVKKVKEKIEKENIIYINDAYNASPISVSFSLETFDKLYNDTLKIVVLGDMLELGEKEIEYHKDIIEKALTVNSDKIYLYGERMKKALENVQKNREKITHFTEKEEIKKLILKEQKKTSILLKGSRGMKLEEIIE